MDDETLSTLMCGVETIINGRPITKVLDDPNDFEALISFFFALEPRFRLVYLIKPIAMFGEGGVKFNIWQMYSGIAG